MNLKNSLNLFNYLFLLFFPGKRTQKEMFIAR